MTKDDPKGSSAEDSTGKFTIEPTKTTGEITSTRIPSVTKLLNRKSLRKAEPSKSNLSSSFPPPIISSPSSALRPASIPPMPPPPVASSQPPPMETEPPAKIQPSTRKGSKNAQSLSIWDLALLSSQDPLQKGIAALFQKGATSVLYLALSPSPSGSSAAVPHFGSTAAVQPAERGVLWTGLKWDPSVTPAIWNDFSNIGIAELPPPGSFTNLTSEASLVRSAFGMKREEWLLLVRVGSPKHCRGMVAVVSHKTLVPALSSVLALLSSDQPKAA